MCINIKVKKKTALTTAGCAHIHRSGPCCFVDAPQMHTYVRVHPQLSPPVILPRRRYPLCRATAVAAGRTPRHGRPSEVPPPPRRVAAVRAKNDNCSVTTRQVNVPVSFIELTPRPPCESRTARRGPVFPRSTDGHNRLCGSVTVNDVDDTK